ncbi:MAG: hypothetical protein ACLQIB_12770 [Isosphaeraceae bacterium]
MDAVANLTSATSLKDLRASSADLAALYVQRLQEENGLLRTQVSDLTIDRERVSNLFHNSDKKAEVLATRLESARTQLHAQNHLDWIVNVLFAIGGAIFSFGVSWPGINNSGRAAVVILGLLVIVVPGTYKMFLNPKIPPAQ